MWEEIKSAIVFYPLDFIGYLLLLLPVAIAAYRWEYLSGCLIATGVFFVVKFFQDTVLNYYALSGKNNHDLQRGFFILDILLISIIYYIALRYNRRSLTILLIATPLTVIALLINYVYNKSLSGGSFFNRLFIIVVTVSYFNVILSENRVKNVLNHPMFWVSSGFLLYSTGTFMTTLFIDYLLDGKKTSYDTYKVFMDMNQLIIWVKCCLVSVGLWVSKFDKDNYIQPI